MKENFCIRISDPKGLAAAGKTRGSFSSFEDAVTAAKKAVAEIEATALGDAYRVEVLDTRGEMRWCREKITEYLEEP